MPDAASDPADAIAAALARLRGRRGPRPDGRGPWAADDEHTSDAGPHGHGGPHGRGGGGMRGPRDPQDPRDEHDVRDENDVRDRRRHGHQRIPDPFGPRSGFPPGAPWSGAHGRFAGPARVRLLEALAAASRPLSVSELAEQIGVDQPRASRLVQQCAGLGLVRREADPDDARRTRIVLTDEGARLVKGFRGNRRAAIEDALADFTDAERAELARLLTKLADSWGR